MSAYDFLPLLPELALVAVAALILILDIVLKPPRRTLFTACAAGGMVLGMILLGVVPQEDSSAFFNGMIRLDAFSMFLRPLFLSAGLLAVLFSHGSREVPSGRYPEYLTLVLLFTAGLSLVGAATHLLMLYVSMEMIGIAAYALTAFNPRHPRSIEAGLKYTIFGGVASGIMLFGLSLLYGISGGLGYTEIHDVLLTLSGTNAPQIVLGFISILFIMTGFAYKIAAVPFHSWCPDAYEGAPTPFTALMSVAPKAAGLAAITRFFLTVLSQPAGSGLFEPTAMVPWTVVLGIGAAATMTFGNLAALTQQNLKRLLAYSSISHAGYMLLGIVALSQQGIAALSAYILIYLIMNMGAFLAILLIAEFTDGENIQDFAGMGKRLPWLAACFTVFLLSLAGLPPMSGFVGKFYLFAALLERTGPWYAILAIVAVLNSVISLFYYARVLRVMYLEPAKSEVPLTVHPAHSVLLGVLAFLALALGLYWDPLAVLVERISKVI